MDPDVPMLFIRDADEKQALAGVTVFACHCDVIGGTEFSADYPFFLQQALRHEFGENFISAFGGGHMRGHQSHQRRGEVGEGEGLDRAEQIGAPLGVPVIAAAKGFGCDHQPGFALEEQDAHRAVEGCHAGAGAGPRAPR